MADEKRRDVQVELSWQGVNVDLDVRVHEPIGTVCSTANPMTANGGARKEQVFDDREGYYTETYSAAQAFTGKYRVVVDQIYGIPQGEKAQVKVTFHKGTPAERVEYFTVAINKDKPQDEVTFTLDGGRR